MPAGQSEKELLKLRWKIIKRNILALNNRQSGVGHGHTIRYYTRCNFNVQSKADMSQLNLPHETNN